MLTFIRADSKFALLISPPPVSIRPSFPKQVRAILKVIINEDSTKHYCLPGNSAGKKHLPSELVSPTFIERIFDGSPASNYPIARCGDHALRATEAEPETATLQWIKSTYGSWLDYPPATFEQGQKWDFCKMQSSLLAAAQAVHGCRWPCRIAIYPASTYQRLDKFAYTAAATAIHLVPICSASHWALLAIRPDHAILVDSMQVNESIRKQAKAQLQA